MFVNKLTAQEKPDLEIPAEKEKPKKLMKKKISKLQKFQNKVAKLK